MGLSDKLASALDRMPAFPQCVQRIMEIHRGATNESREMVAILEKDPVMAVKILRVVNSAYYGLSRQVGSIQHAMVILGPNTVRNMVIAFSLVGMLPATNTAGYDVDRYLLHSLSTAAFSRQIALHFGDAESIDAYMIGLLHDFGRVLFAWHFPDHFEKALALANATRIPLHQAESEIFGRDHAEIGAVLTQMWHFPEHLVAHIRQHHAAPPATGPGRSLFLANQLSKWMEIGDSGNVVVAPLPPGIGGTLGDSYEQMLDTLPQISRLAEEARHYLIAGR